MFMRMLRVPAVVVLAVAAVLAGTRGTQAASPCGALVDVDQCLDDFTCYKTRLPPPNTVTLNLADQFETVTAQISRPFRLCTPSDKEAEGTVDEDTHLASYRLRHQNPIHIQRSGIRMTNQLGDLWLDTLQPSMLLVPSSKNLTSVPPQPSPTSHVDHYKCYRVKVTAGTPKFARNTRVSVSDQFSPTPRQLTLIKPRYLCAPVSVNGGGTANPDVHLVCYVARPALGEPHHQRVQGVFMNNELGPVQVSTRKEAEFCIPSTKSFSPPP